MQILKNFVRILFPIVVLFTAAEAGVAQERPQEIGSLAALIAEVRQLRAAVEESNRQQAQLQTVSVYLSAQQSRLVQISGRLEAARNQLGVAAQKSQRARESELSHLLHAEEAR
jgi:hypothetical protein